MPSTTRKPIPVPADDDRPYWDALRAHRLVLARCVSCGTLSQRLQMVCPQCRGEAFDWREVSGRGRIYTYTIARQTWVTGFEDELPYVVVSVAIEEQPSLFLTTNLVGDYDIDALDIDLPVVADFEPRGDMVLLQFRLDGSRDV